MKYINFMPVPTAKLRLSKEAYIYFLRSLDISAGKFPALLFSMRADKMKNFILVDKRILDFREYRRNYLVLKKLISIDVREYFTKLGFGLASSENRKRYQASFTFYNAESDMEVSVTIRKKNRIEFV